MLFLAGLFTGRDPASRSVQEVVKNPRVELGWIKRCSISHWSGWVGLGWVGLGWVGLGWVGLGWVGLGRVGSGRVGSVIFQMPRIGSRHSDQTRHAKHNPTRGTPCFLGAPATVACAQIIMTPGIPPANTVASAPVDTPCAPPSPVSAKKDDDASCKPSGRRKTGLSSQWRQRRSHCLARRPLVLTLLVSPGLYSRCGGGGGGVVRYGGV